MAMVLFSQDDFRFLSQHIGKETSGCHVQRAVAREFWNAGWLSLIGRIWFQLVSNCEILKICSDFFRLICDGIWLFILQNRS